MRLSKTEIFFSVMAVCFAMALALAFWIGPKASDAFMELPSRESGKTVPYRININTAGAEELQMLSGIGPELAGRILAYRSAHGAFTALDQLTNVKGVTQAMVEELRDAADVQ